MKTIVDEVLLPSLDESRLSFVFAEFGSFDDSNQISIHSANMLK